MCINSLTLWVFFAIYNWKEKYIQQYRPCACVPQTVTEIKVFMFWDYHRHHVRERVPTWLSPKSHCTIQSLRLHKCRIYCSIPDETTTISSLSLINWYQYNAHSKRGLSMPSALSLSAPPTPCSNPVNVAYHRCLWRIEYSVRVLYPDENHMFPTSQ